MSKSTQLEGILSRATSTTPKAVPQATTADVVKLAEPAKAVEPVPTMKKAKAKEEQAPAREKQLPVQVEVPESVERALKIRAATDRTTTRNLILQGLRAIGFEVSEEEMRDRRKRG
ncbi:hypothetical protein AKG11_31230 [Shinella sp. SUS2]|uniref:hypothetical protein n=1 Tax=unclassified Shinella TaxID=2643062 RepID=UPI000680AEF8|nr:MULTISPECIES: hypothetical protein [unclassified Shinella]KNY13060.1 hypothetical protein AKG11_31230 [Shinella sp. SUS2]KOC71781.1 hypothetical protein AKG10_31000 [Shinella sp. GWS1]